MNRYESGINYISSQNVKPFGSIPKVFNISNTMHFMEKVWRVRDGSLHNLLLGICAAVVFLMPSACKQKVTEEVYDCTNINKCERYEKLCLCHLVAGNFKLSHLNVCTREHLKRLNICQTGGIRCFMCN